jgi:hypothetical protein
MLCQIPRLPLVNISGFLPSLTQPQNLWTIKIFWTVQLSFSCTMRTPNLLQNAQECFVVSSIWLYLTLSDSIYFHPVATKLDCESSRACELSNSSSWELPTKDLSRLTPQTMGMAILPTIPTPPHISAAHHDHHGAVPATLDQPSWSGWSACAPPSLPSTSLPWPWFGWGWSNYIPNCFSVDDIKSPFWIFQCYPIIPEYTCIPRTFNIIFQSGFLWVELGRLKFYWVLPGSAPLSHGSHHPRNSHGTRWNPKHGDCKMLIPIQSAIVWNFIYPLVN